MEEIRQLCATDAGMYGLWDLESFQDVVDYDSWSRRLESDESILKEIGQGTFVPINVGADGASEILIRFDEHLTERETKYRLVGSQPYSLVSSGAFCVSGIEHVDATTAAESTSVGVIPPSAGKYDVTIHLIGWDEEPGMQLESGGPAEGALPDFIVTIVPSKTTAHRTKIMSFD
ncbi:hypothetical protein ACFL2H_11940 [Planctomycetota bacterium]